MRAALIPAAILVLIGGGAAAGSSFRVIHNFCAQASCTDGQFPFGKLTVDATGNIYGVTVGGGVANRGIVYELKRGRHHILNILYNFCKETGCPNGTSVTGGVIRDTKGNLYGTTYAGGASDDGVAYRLAPQKSGEWSQTLLTTFTGANGAHPNGALGYAGQTSGLQYDGVSPLYGVTGQGGIDPNGGTMFTLTPNGANWDFETIFNFSTDGGTGYAPYSAPIVDAAGNVFGTANNNVVYKLAYVDSTWNEEVVYTFCQGCNDNLQGPDGITFDASGAIVGTATFGGPYCTFPHGREKRCGGGVFRLTPSSTNWNYAALYDFCAVNKNCKDGKVETIQTAPVIDASGNIYGTTSDGGRYGFGVLFRIQTNGAYEVLHNFCNPRDCSDGATPDGLAIDAKGHILGVAVQGGPNNGGAIFEYTP